MRADDRQRTSAARDLARSRGVGDDELGRFLRTYAYRFGAHSLLRNLAAADFRLDASVNTLEYMFTKRLADSALRPYVREQDRVLSVGCGDGLLEVNLARRGCRVWGVDVDPNPVRVARVLARRLGVSEHCRFSRVSGTRLPFRRGSFDVVLYFHSLHEIRGPKGTLREANRVLDASGRVLVVDEAEEWKRIAHVLDGGPFVLMEKRALFPGAIRAGGLARRVVLLHLRRPRSARNRA